MGLREVRAVLGQPSGSPGAVVMGLHEGRAVLGQW